MITSSVAGEGKSFIASNLALSFALSGRRVVLVDLDLYRNKLAGIFNVSNDAGVADFLIGKKDVAQIIKKTSASENLFVLPAGYADDVNLSELLLNGKAQKLIEYLETMFDVVVIDTTPVLAITDAFTISSWCDATIYVIRHGITQKSHLQRLDDNVALHRMKNAGLVFNGIKKRGLGKNYGYGYGYGYDFDYGYQYRSTRTLKKSKV